MAGPIITTLGEVDELKAMYQELLSRPIRRVLYIGGGGSGKLLNRPGLLCGWSFVDAGGTGVTFYLHDGGGVDGEIAFALKLPANGSDHGGPSYDGVLFQNGFYHEDVSGVPAGSFWIKY